MSREALIGMTLLLTLAVLGAGQEAPGTRAADAAEPVDVSPVALPGPAAAPAVREERRLTFDSPAGTLQLIGASTDNELSLTVRFDDTI
ncbi:MAG: hypothetical protein AAFU65_13210 [Pseudomonadota bacterium]